MPTWQRDSKGTDDFFRAGQTIHRLRKTGEVHSLILPTVNAEVFSLALENFASEVGAAKRKRILLVLDQAGWHTAKKLRIPEGIHLEFLPSHSPELQPSERLWPLSNEGVARVDAGFELTICPLYGIRLKSDLLRIE